MQHLQPNTTLQGGKYKIERVLGQGGFGITYRAMMKETASGKLGAIEVEVPVAIKVFFMSENCMRSEGSSYVSVPSTGSRTIVEQYRKKFVKEANNLAELWHPNIVRVIDVFEENGTDYYVMEYLEGGSLRDLVKQKGIIAEEEALRYVSLIGYALNYMHTEKHMCHFDVKPSNIMLDKNGVPKLIDFGISKNYDNEGNQTSSTPVGISKGFAPLEQYQQSVTEFSPQTDIYALGATLYYLLTGDVPPEASIVFNDGLPELPSSISASTCQAIEKAMQPRKKDRPQSMKAFIEMLNNAQITTEIEHSTPSEEEDEDDDVTYYAQEGDSIQNVEHEQDSLHESHQIEEVPLKENSEKIPEKKNYGCLYLGLLALVIILLLIISFIVDGNESSGQIDYTTYNERLVEAAESGDADAQFYLGRCYHNGFGVQQNYLQAVKWYTKSASQGNGKAQHNLGVCYYEGIGVTQDYKEAIDWLTKAAEQNVALSQSFLGVCYASGEGVEQNSNTAFSWFTKAAEQNLAIAQYYLGVCYASGEGVEQNLNTAFSWFTKAAEQNDVEAQFALGICYANGEGVEQNLNAAFGWWSKAAEQNLAIAQYYLGMCYYHGDGVTQDNSKAKEWFKKAADQGNEEAKEMLKELQVNN